VDGRTDFGKIYRGRAIDGLASAYLFGSTSAFDSQIHFDDIVANSETLPAAVFKFLALRLAGNPTISLANGGEINLGLIGVNGITSGGPARHSRSLEFTAFFSRRKTDRSTGSEISFSGLHDITFALRRGRQSHACMRNLDPEPNALTARAQ
jgi:hypothetical protein